MEIKRTTEIKISKEEIEEILKEHFLIKEGIEVDEIKFVVKDIGVEYPGCPVNMSDYQMTEIIIKNTKLVPRKNIKSEDGFQDYRDNFNSPESQMTELSYLSKGRK